MHVCANWFITHTKHCQSCRHVALPCYEECKFVLRVMHHHLLMRHRDQTSQRFVADMFCQHIPQHFQLLYNKFAQAVIRLWDWVNFALFSRKAWINFIGFSQYLIRVKVSVSSAETLYQWAEAHPSLIMHACEQSHAHHKSLQKAMRNT